MPDRSHDYPGVRHFTFETIMAEHPRNYLVLRLTGYSDTDQVLFDYASIRIAEIIQQLDTVNGVKFVWNDSLKYGEFIRALDVPWIAGAKCWMVFEDSLWMLNQDTQADMTGRGPDYHPHTHPDVDL
jgi:hypothetical protein